MLNFRDRGILLEIIKHCQRILSKNNEMDFDSFLSNDDLREIICFNLLQIGELAKKFTDDFLNRYSKMPWKQIKGMRDKVAHGYGTLDFQLVYETVQTNIPDLLRYCQDILAKVDSFNKH